MILDINNFIKPISQGDRYIYITDPSGNAILYIDPYSSEFFNKGSHVHILTDGKLNMNNLLDFSSVPDAMTAVNKLNDAKKTIIDIVPGQCNTFIPLTGSTNISGSLIPNNSTSDLGSSEYPWRHIHVSGSTIFIGGKQLSVHGDNLLFLDKVLVNQDTFAAHTGSTLHLEPWMRDVLLASSGATTSDPFAVKSDIKKTLVSPSDTIDNYLIYKVTGTTTINVSISGDTNGNEVLVISADLREYYNSNEVDSLISGVTGSTYTKNEVYNKVEVDSLISGVTGSTYTKNEVYNKVEVDSLISGVTGSTYTKNEVYNKVEVDSLISGVTGSTYTKVAIDDKLSYKADLVGGLVKSDQLPSYVDDVIEVGYYSLLPLTGETGKIYVTINDEPGEIPLVHKANMQYRWSGTSYIPISNSMDFATQAEAEAGTDNTKVMTSLRVLQSVVYNTVNYSYSVLTTVSKTITGAINEIKTSVDNRIPYTGATQDINLNTLSVKNDIPAVHGVTTGLKINAVRGEVLAFGEVCYRGSNFMMYKSLNTADSTTPGIFICCQSGSSGTTGEFLTCGYACDTGLTLTPGLVYLSATGKPTSTKPVAGSGAVVQILGSSSSSTSYRFNPEGNTVKLI